MTLAGPAMQLKQYRFDPALRDEFLAVWREIARIRQACGFTVHFAVVDDERHVLTWAVSHPRFAEEAAAYYANAERQSFSRTDYDPATGAYFDSGRNDQRNIEDYILAAEITWVSPQPIPGAAPPA